MDWVGEENMVYIVVSSDLTVSGLDNTFFLCAEFTILVPILELASAAGT